MATEEIKLPEIGEGVNEGELVGWLVEPGQSVEVDQPLVELMTDKATVEVPSPRAGQIKELKFSQGDTVEVGSALLTLETGVSQASSTQHTEQNKVSNPGKKTQTPLKQTTDLPRGFQQPSSRESNCQPPSSINPPPVAPHILATPSTRRLARSLNVDINTIQGTGLAGRVTREDVSLASTNQGLSTQGSLVSSGLQPSGSSLGVSWENRATSSSPSGFVDRREPMRGIRKKIAENMQMAKKVIPHFTIMDEAHISALRSLRMELKSQFAEQGVSITYLPFVIKALIATLREFPKLNASIDDGAQEIIYKGYFNIGFAADTPQGLFVPVIQNADQKTIFQLSQEIAGLAQKARQGQLSLGEMKGSCFTVTNIGSVGGTYATPIINHPEVAIFGMYKMQERPLLRDGVWEVAYFMNFTLTCDHRLIDGAEAARFLSAFIKRIESPGRLMVDML